MRAARVSVDLGALRHNLSRVRAFAPHSKVLAVLKAQAYGHGLLACAEALQEADAFAVAFVDEANCCREQGITHPIVVLQGAQNRDELRLAAKLNVRLAVHHEHQIDDLQAEQLSMPLVLKLDTGMHRLGLLPEHYADYMQRLAAHAAGETPWLMTHLACADEPEHPLNRHQLDEFFRVAQHHEGDSSCANSAAIVNFPESHGDWVRPGIMLYGASPDSQSAAQHGLLPVMSFHAPVVSVKTLSAGDAVGYGARWTATQDTRIAVIAAGYADGYPRHAPNGTPVMLHGVRCPLLGRVSMDMIAVDASACAEVAVGDMAELWGKDLPIDEVARAAGTLSYELLCHVGGIQAARDRQ